VRTAARRALTGRATAAGAETADAPVAPDGAGAVRLCDEFPWSAATATATAASTAITVTPAMPARRAARRRRVRVPAGAGTRGSAAAEG
jgi:hypothetical protein